MVVVVIANAYTLMIVNRLLKGIMKNDIPFGRNVIVVLGK